MKEYRIATEIFEIVGRDKTLIYAPLLGLACSSTSKLINTLCDIKDNESTIPGKNKQVEQLLSMGFIEEKQSKAELQKKTYQSFTAPFLPCEVTLFMTANCNLACKYCYGNGGDCKNIIDHDVAFSTIDLLFDNAKRTQTKEVRVSFHGGGEPTLEFKQIQACVNYTKDLSKSTSIKSEFGLTSNGVIQPSSLTWIIENIDHINISFDGPEDIQNHQRPTLDGRGSFKAVTQTLKALDSAEKQYCIRGTITQFCEDRIPEIAEYIVNNHTANTLQLEPMFGVGRALTSKMVPPNPENFIHGYLEAEKICKKREVKLKFSGHRFPHTSNAFCGIGRKNFAVTPEGLVTSCFEVLEEVDERSEVFFFGKYHEGSFLFDEKKIRTLREFSETTPQFCKNCFAQFHCTGDCRGKGLFLATMENYQGGGRCHIVQGLIKAKLLNYFT
ncbi:MAG: SPASM domain-containing protein [Desulfobulbaceae bacterium]|nr:SPASM domain-containing protein [Desulfobulbaceae bacterium]